MALAAAGHEVKAFSDRLSAIPAFEAAQRIQLLISRATFPPGQPHGVALARMARAKQPDV